MGEKESYLEMDYVWNKGSSSTWDLGEDGACKLLIGFSKDAKIPLESIVEQFRSLLYSLGFQYETIKEFF